MSRLLPDRFCKACGGKGYTLAGDAYLGHRQVACPCTRTDGAMELNREASDHFWRREREEQFRNGGGGFW
jgi:hypothetical protein